MNIQNNLFLLIPVLSSRTLISSPLSITPAHPYLKSAKLVVVRLFTAGDHIFDQIH
jgi:hypothetical protein